MTRSYDDLVAEAAASSVDGWDFAWLDGRATEERPSWGYQGLLAEHLGRASAALDVQTGGGEVLAGAVDRAAATPTVLAATESWPPNVALASARLTPLGGVVVAAPDEPPLPFADRTFDLVSSRHPVRPWWAEIARVLAPGGLYVAQHIGPESGFELIEWFVGPLSPSSRAARHPDGDRAGAEAAGLEVVDLRSERLRLELHDVGAVVHLLRKVVWWVPDFTVDRYAARLRSLHERIEAEGPFVAHSSRTLVVARRPAG